MGIKRGKDAFRKITSETYIYNQPLRRNMCHPLNGQTDHKRSVNLLGGIHKLRHTLREGRGSTKFDKGGGILNFVTSHFKNSIKATLHI